jgi:hypothetical protein
MVKSRVPFEALDHQTLPSSTTRMAKILSVGKVDGQGAIKGFYPNCCGHAMSKAGACGFLNLGHDNGHTAWMYSQHAAPITSQ